MHTYDRGSFFREGRFGPARRQDAPGRCDRAEGRREFGHRPGGPGSGSTGSGGPGFVEDGPRGFRGGPRGPRAKVGNLRLAILALLAEEGRNGYSMIQEIAQRSGGLWQPSPGSMYPALSQLEDEGLIEVQAQEGKKAYALTEAGSRYVQDNAEALKAPWDAHEEGGRGGGRIELRQALHGLMGAAGQVAQAGSGTQVKEAASLLNTARKALYRLLAEDEEGV